MGQEFWNRPGAWLAVLFALPCLALAGNLSLDFNRDTAGLPPAGTVSSGGVAVVQHPLRAIGDLSVALTWTNAAGVPWVKCVSPDGRLPERGVLRFDLLIDRPAGTLHLRGRTDRGRTAFHYMILAGGRAFSVGADGERREIICIDAPPRSNQWYAVRLTYDLPSRLFNVVMDSNWRSGEAPSLPVLQGETLTALEWSAERAAGLAAYYVDSVRLVAADEATAESSASLPVACHPRTIRWTTPLLAPRHDACAIIVYPAGVTGAAELAERVRDTVCARSGRTLACLPDRLVTDPGTGLIREDYLDRPVIALGNAAENGALYALATRFLTLSNRKWPGGDRYCVRTVLEPFRADVNWVVVEAGSRAGLEAGVAALCRRLQAEADSNLALPYFRELGAATGAWQERPFRHGDVDLTRSIEEIKEQLKQKYGPSVRIVPGSLYYYDAWTWLQGGAPEAAKFAAAVLLMEMERDPYYIPTGHYNFDRTVKALQICFTSGVMDEALINRFEAALARTMANPAYFPNDWYAESLRADGGMRMMRYSDRHWLATLSNFICGSDYVLGHCRLNPITRALVEDYHRGYLRAAARLSDCFRSANMTSESGDNAVAVLNLMALTGHREYVANGALARSAEYHLALMNNLGYFVGEGCYIGADSLQDPLPGGHIFAAAAFFTGDPVFQWLWKHLAGIPWTRTSHTNPAFEDEMPEAFPSRYLGLLVLPFDPGLYRERAAPRDASSDWGTFVTRRLTEPYERLFDHAVFRDGFGPGDAFLSLYANQIAHEQVANTIAQYTDCGQILLFAHSALPDRWCRNAALASNGRPCRPGAACLLKAALREETVSALSSTDPYTGNTEWTRTIVRRAGRYFVVLDEFRAATNDTFTFACRWRTPHPATLEDGGWTVRAPSGVVMRLVNADGVYQESVHEDYDGAFRPFVLTQHHRATLREGDTVGFRNLFYAVGPEEPVAIEARPLGATAVLVQGRGSNWTETALVGVGRSPSNLTGLCVEADIFHVSTDKVVAANATRVRLGARELFQAAAPTNVVISPLGGELAALLSRAFAEAHPPPPAKAEQLVSYGVSNLWTFRDFARPAERLPVVAIMVNKSPWSHRPEELIDPLAPLGTVVPHNCVSWKGTQTPVELTLDLGAVRDIASVRLIGAVANGFIRRYAWGEGDLTFTVQCSDDGFQSDIREDPAPQAVFREHSFPRAQYTYAARLPEYVVTVGQQARYVRLGITARSEDLALQKVVVEGQGRDPRLVCELRQADLNGDGTAELLVKTSHGEVVAVSAKGAKLWSRVFPGEITAWDVADLETDARPEVLVYTTEDACYALEGNGKQRWRADLYEFSKQGPEEVWQRWYSPYCFICLTPWRPDATGKREVIGWTHVPPMRIGPDLSITNAGALGRALFAMTDRAVYGREVLISSGSALLVDDADGRRLVSRPLKGPLSGNGEFPVFVRAHAVADKGQRGIVGLNPTSVEWVPVEPAGTGWGEFSEVPLTASLIWDMEGDGVSELLIGYKDGFVRIYRLADGAIVGRICAGAPVTGLAALPGHVVVATRAGIRLYDAALQERGALDISATGVVTLSGPEPVACAADATGRILAFR